LAGNIIDEPDLLDTSPLNSRIMERIHLLLSCLFLPGISQVSAQLRIPNLFDDHMILQQNTSNAVWRFTTPRKKISAKVSWGSRAGTTALDQGNWEIMLKTPGAGTGHHLTLTGHMLKSRETPWRFPHRGFQSRWQSVRSVS
jgi:hypothetical protein